MTNDQIMQIAARHSAYADCTPTLRGDAILAFAREVVECYVASWYERMAVSEDVVKAIKSL